MKTNKRISLILTAALALSACASAADSATAAAAAETAAATPEPTAAPEPVGELHALAETGQNKFGNVICQTRPALDDEAFARLSSPLNSTKEGGLGLGISIVRELLSSYGSHLLYERIPQGGLRASFELECVKENPGEGEKE